MKFFLSIVLTTCCIATTEAYTFRTIKVPFAGSTNTTVSGVNDRGVVTGMYSDAAGANHGFLDGVRGSAHPLLLVVSKGINNDETVVGWYGSIEGFLYRGGSFWTFRCPVRREEGNFIRPHVTEPLALNNKGVAVGDCYYSVPDEPSHGFIYDPVTRVTTLVDAPTGAGTALVAINNNNEAIGHSGGQLFKWQNGVFTFFTIPTLPEAEISGITDQGVLAGNSGSVGFIYDGTTVQIIEAPGASVTSIEGIREDTHGVWVSNYQWRDEWIYCDSLKEKDAYNFS